MARIGGKAEEKDGFTRRRRNILELATVQKQPADDWHWRNRTFAIANEPAYRSELQESSGRTDTPRQWSGEVEPEPESVTYDVLGGMFPKTL